MLGKIIVGIWVTVLLVLLGTSFYHITLGRGRMSRGVLAGLAFLVVMAMGILLVNWTRL